MKQLIQNLKTGKLSLKDVPYPLCKTEGLLVKTEASLVSVGTEKSIIELSNKSLLGKIRARPDLFRRAWEKAKKEGVFKVFKESLNRLDEPFPLGYSASGVVVEVGSGVKDFKIGDKVAIAGSGYANHSEYNFVPENLCLKIPRRDDGEYLDFEEGAFCMVGGIVMQGIREAELKPGDNVAVIGLGLLGLLTVQIVRAMGCEPIGIDIDDYKIDKAQKLGCQHTLNIRKIDAEELVMSLTGNKGVNSVIITAASRNSAPIELAQKIAGQRARIILVGVCDIHLDRKYFWDKELVFKVSKAAGADDLERENIRTFLTFLAKNKISIKDLITHRFSFVDVLSAYQMLLKGKSSQIGVVLDYSKEGSPRTNEQEDVIIRKQGVNLEADKGGRRNIGLIGGGAFTKNILLPVLTKIRNIELVGVATTRGMTSEHIASKFDFKYFTTDYKEILEDKNIRSVFITTRHGSHSKFVVEALQHNKDVFVEKPLCLNKGELSEIKGAFQKTNNDLMVGFNRRYSSLVKDIKEFFDKDEPFVINCRINAGFIDSSHWTQGFAEGGGRIIGEVCHFVDLLQFITSSYPIKVYTEGISNSNNYSPNDNIISVIKFQDGSVANITYTSKGSKSYSREILEIYQRNSVYYLEDFKKAIKIKAGTKKKKKLFSQDMGYLDELKCFFSDNVKKINFNDYLINSLTVFAIQESLREGRLVTISNTI